MAKRECCQRVDQHETNCAWEACFRGQDKLKSEINQLRAQNALFQAYISRINNKFYPLKITYPNVIAVVETAHIISEALSDPDGSQALAAVRGAMEAMKKTEDWMTMTEEDFRMEVEESAAKAFRTMNTLKQSLADLKKWFA